MTTTLMESHLTKKDRQKGVPSSGLRNVEVCEVDYAKSSQSSEI